MNSSQNVDYDEIQKFNESAATWWDTSGEFKPLHDINPLRLSFMTDCVDLSHKHILDIGCGGGILTEALARTPGTTVTGIDLASAALQAAKTHLKGQDALEIEYLEISAEDCAEERAEQYDVVTCMEMLEHVPAPADIVAACAKLTKPQGDVFLSTINRNPLAYGMAIIGAEYLLNLLPQGTHDYDKFIRPSELERWCRQNGLAVQSLKGLGYNPLSKRYYLTNNIKVNYLIHAKKI